MKDNESIIGTIEVITKYFKEELISQINSVDLFDTSLDCDGIENVQDNVDMVMELLNGIYQDIITGVLCKEDRIKVCYNPMGAYYYEKFEESEEDL